MTEQHSFVIHLTQHMNICSERRSMNNNMDIRFKMLEHNIKRYEIAEKIGIYHSTLSVWMRKELEGERKEKVLQAINEIIAERE